MVAKLWEILGEKAEYLNRRKNPGKQYCSKRCRGVSGQQVRLEFATGRWVQNRSILFGAVYKNPSCQKKGTYVAVVQLHLKFQLIFGHHITSTVKFEGVQTRIAAREISVL